MTMNYFTVFIPIPRAGNDTDFCISGVYKPFDIIMLKYGYEFRMHINDNDLGALTDILVGRHFRVCIMNWWMSDLFLYIFVHGPWRSRGSYSGLFLAIIIKHILLFFSAKFRNRSRAINGTVLIACKTIC